MQESRYSGQVGTKPENNKREWCAAIDLKSFFDKIPHGLILKLIRRKISDERLVARPISSASNIGNNRSELPA